MIIINTLCMFSELHLKGLDRCFSVAKWLKVG